MVHRALQIGVLAVLLIGSSRITFAVAFAEEIVSFATHDGLEIQCQLSYPDLPGKRSPGMLLISGSGLHDALRRAVGVGSP